VDSAEAADLAEADSTEAVDSMEEAVFMVEAVSTEAAATGKLAWLGADAGSCRQRSRNQAAMHCRREPSSALCRSCRLCGLSGGEQAVESFGHRWVCKDCFA
jgi:MinD superfamily P-loop ATPase